MSYSQRKVGLDGDSLVTDMVNFYDEFMDFNSHCAFILDATALFLRSDSDLDRVSVEGFSSLAWQLKRRANELKEEFQRIHEKSRLIETSRIAH